MPTLIASKDEFLSRGRIFNTIYGYICPDLCFAQSTTGNKKRSKKMKRVLTLQCEHCVQFTPFFK